MVARPTMIAGQRRLGEDDKGRHGLSDMLGQHCRKSGAGVGLEVGHQGVSFYNILILFGLVWKQHGTLNPMI